MKKSILQVAVIALTIVALIFTSYPVSVQAQQPDPIDSMREKWLAFLTGGQQIDLNDEDIRQAVETNAKKVTNDQKNGFWDLLLKDPARKSLWADYASTTDSSHITLSYNRLKDMAIAYSTQGSNLYRNEQLRQDIIAGLDWMYTNRFNENKAKYNNWWDWEIGSPLSLGDIMTLMYDHLSPEQVARYTRTIDKFIPDPTLRLGSTLKETGANLLDKALAVLIRGVIGKSETKIVQARSSISPVFPPVTSGDGFYSDGSFIQHNNIAYTGSYGSVLLGDMAKLLTILNDSPWPIQDPNLANTYDWITNSFEPLIYNGHMMEMVSGRAVSRFNNNTRGTAWTINRMSQFAPPDLAARYKSMVKEWVLSDTSVSNKYEGMPIRDLVLFKALMKDTSVVPRGDLIVHHQFSAMDRVVHAREGYAYAISMSSSRISNYEGGINGEHTKGWYTGDGMTYLYNNDAAQFRDAFWPTVDSYRMPGTTSDGLPRTGSKVTSKSWVGGVSMDQLYGAAGMDLAPPGSKLTGKKSWFMFDNEIVALGAGITTSDSRKVETIVENRMINSAGDNKLIVNGETMPSNLGWSKNLTGVKWANLQGTAAGADIGYYFPETANVSALREARSGSWRDINPTGPTDTITRNYASLAIDHGIKQTDQSYSYVLLPTLNAATTQSYSENPDVRILSNTAKIQAVQETKLGLTGIHFWEPGTLDRVRAYQPVSLMMKEKGDELTISVSDPTQSQSKVKVELAAAASQVLASDPSVKVLRTLPTLQLEVDTRGSLGKSHTIQLKINPDQEVELPGETDYEPDPAAKVRIPVTEDTFVNGGTDANNNFGTRGFLNIRNGSGNTDRKVFLKFALPSSMQEIHSVSLNVYGETKDGSGNISDIGVYEVPDDSWSETTLTFANKPAPGKQIDVATFTTPEQWRKFDVTPFVTAQQQGDKVASFALQQVGSNLASTIRSRKSEEGKYQAYLEVLLKDTKAPTTSVRVDGNSGADQENYKDVTLHFTAVDDPNGWGVLRSEYRINGGKWMAVKAGQVIIREKGVQNIEYRSIDKAGNVEEAQKLTVVLANADTELSGNQSVVKGEPLIVTYRIKKAVSDMYAHDLTLDFDAQVLEFVSAESMQRGVSILKSKAEDTGRLRLAVAGEGQEIQGNADLLKLTFKVKKATDAVNGKIEVVQAILADKQGSEMTVTPSSLHFSVQASTEGPGPVKPNPGDNGNGTDNGNGNGTDNGNGNSNGNGNGNGTDNGNGNGNSNGNGTGTGTGTDNGGHVQPEIPTDNTEAVVLNDLKGHWAEEKIQEAVKKGLILGYPDGSFQPDKKITRAEFTSLLVRGLKLKEETELTFSDHDLINHWAKSDIAKAVKKGIISGYEDNTFRAEKDITRTELTMMAVKSLNLAEESPELISFVDQADIPVWAQGWVAAAVSKGLVTGRDNQTFAPLAPATRAEAVVILLNLLSLRK
ncbi:polysaccharide lyase family 8 super-sandwich domain-containing protein [Paenibacillus sp. GbtcB18]|uniref:polysaccharide lyase family 8 super-sandwich domain-containing protein n=1 Tax=Paenibacillus sp. GbtcB18 TaxID=2824763 RepID=UPI001C3086D5|nr:polysaccharide lyase family 8 super-sandwich domain-containing protein [Paenibacillus sp. GbtcB18]